MSQRVSQYLNLEDAMELLEEVLLNYKYQESDLLALAEQYRDFENLTVREKAVVEAGDSGLPLLSVHEAISNTDSNTRMPRLAIAPAQAEILYCETSSGQSNCRILFSTEYPRWEDEFVSGELNGFGSAYSHSARAPVPLVPPSIRPNKLDGCFVLWEVEWEVAVPADPILLYKFSKRLYGVLATWDMTELEAKIIS